VGVDGVISDYPADRSRVEHERRPIETPELGGPAHQRAPREGEAEKNLRPIRDALHEWIDGNHQQRGDAGDHRKAIELDQHQQTDQRLRNHKDCRLRDRNLLRGDWPGASALDQAIKIAVDQIVPGAACAAHCKCADKEQDNMPKVRKSALVHPGKTN
jgi:hypothetical protein